MGNHLALHADASGERRWLEPLVLASLLPAVIVALDTIMTAQSVATAGFIAVLWFFGFRLMRVAGDRR